MSKDKSLFEEIKAGLEQAIEYDKGNIKLKTTKMETKVVNGKKTVNILSEKVQYKNEQEKN